MYENLCTFINRVICGYICTYCDLHLYVNVTLYPQKLALISPTSGGCLVGIVRSRTQATELKVKLRYVNVTSRCVHVE
jgi:hypothetical protein